ncbi:MAG: glycosyltransferase family 2 protein [Nitrososphaerota archaeon]
MFEALLSSALQAVAAIISFATVLTWLWMIFRRKMALRGFEKLGGTCESMDTLVSVVVPGRNVEGWVDSCLPTLLAQRNVWKEVIFVDDDSADGTSRMVLEKYVPRGVRYLRLGWRPDRWLGKNWACWRGYQYSSGDWLLFIDADTVLFDGCVIADALSYAERNNLDALSLNPLLDTRALSSKIMLPLLQNILWSFFRPIRTNSPETATPFLFGAFILIRRRVYEDIGGHEAIKERILDDRALAQFLKQRRYRALLLDGSKRFGAEFAGSLSGYLGAVKRLMADYAYTGNIKLLKYYIVGAVIQLLFPHVAFLAALVLRDSLLLLVAGASIILNMLSNYLEVRRLGVRNGLIYVPLTLAANWILTASLITAQLSIRRGRVVFSWRGRKIET